MPLTTAELSDLLELMEATCKLCVDTSAAPMIHRATLVHKFVSTHINPPYESHKFDTYPKKLKELNNV